MKDPPNQRGLPVINVADEDDAEASGIRCRYWLATRCWLLVAGCW
jgi:hypothetical protein